MMSFKIEQGTPVEKLKPQLLSVEQNSAVVIFPPQMTCINFVLTLSYKPLVIEQAYL